MDFTKAWDSITSYWVLKVALTWLMSAIAFIWGNTSAGFLALWALVFIDLLSKWAAITKKHIDEAAKTGCHLGWKTGFIDAWEKGILSSHEMKFQFLPKCGIYLAILIAAYLLSYIIPPKVILGIDWSQAAGDLVAIYLALTEFISINENFVAMGYGFLAPLSARFKRQRSEMFGDGEAKKDE